jgi:hypothetical protein
MMCSTSGISNKIKMIIAEEIRKKTVLFRNSDMNIFGLGLQHINNRFSNQHQRKN